MELLPGVPSCGPAALRCPCAEVACAAVRKLSLLQLRWGGLRCCRKAALQLLPKSFYSGPAALWGCRGRFCQFFAWERKRDALRKNLELIIPHFEEPSTQNLDFDCPTQGGALWSGCSLVSISLPMGPGCCNEAAAWFMQLRSCCAGGIVVRLVLFGGTSPRRACARPASRPIALP